MPEAGSPSIDAPDYWWYESRAGLLRAMMGPYIGQPARVLDVGSADGPSVGWLRGSGQRVALDLDPRGLRPGDVCGSAMQLPFDDATFDVVAAFDVVEHCEPESTALSELYRVVRPGGRLLMSVPAYQWAWSNHDVHNGHYRRYTRPRARRAVRAAGFEVVRDTYAFFGTFPAFALDRLSARVRSRGTPPTQLGPGEVPPLPRTSALVDRALRGLCKVDAALLPRVDLPFGSSIFIAARRPFFTEDAR